LTFFEYMSRGEKERGRTRVMSVEKRERTDVLCQRCEICNSFDGPRRPGCTCTKLPDRATQKREIVYNVKLAEFLKRG
jgi:hypothetical protein